MYHIYHNDSQWECKIATQKGCKNTLPLVNTVTQKESDPDPPKKKWSPSRSFNNVLVSTTNQNMTTRYKWTDEHVRLEIIIPNYVSSCYASYIDLYHNHHGNNQPS